MAERPIIFSGPVVKAILDGRKTMTRRVLKPQPKHVRDTWHGDAVECWTEGKCPVCEPPYHVGDRLWCRETWRAHRVDDDLPPGALPPTRIWHEADLSRDNADVIGKRRPSIHMPRWASRLTLTVTEVRVQRLQEISEADAVAEGCPGWYSPQHPDMGVTDGRLPHEEFADLWNSINAKRPGCAWEDDPWVVAVSFTAERRNIDA